MDLHNTKKGIRRVAIGSFQVVNFTCTLYDEFDIMALSFEVILDKMRGFMSL